LFGVVGVLVSAALGGFDNDLKRVVCGVERLQLSRICEMFRLLLCHLVMLTPDEYRLAEYVFLSDQY
jgi:hypothetical protein